MSPTGHPKRNGEGGDAPSGEGETAERTLEKEIVTPEEEPRIEDATAAEWWAHCRPHGSGHQMHFDSDDEGMGGVIRHPICSAIVFVTGGVGGPTLVTDQTSASYE